MKQKNKMQNKQMRSIRKLVNGEVFNLIEWLYLRQKNNLVYFDELTGVHSRHYYDRVLKVKYSPIECAVIFIDINGLKTVNDTKGHYAGSELIKGIAQQLSNLQGVKELCRMGGDEFLLIGGSRFDATQLNSIARIAYGVYIKEKYEDLGSGISKADELMYKHKQKIKGINQIECR